MGRKSHVKKDESAVAVLKNAPKRSEIYKKMSILKNQAARPSTFMQWTRAVLGHCLYSEDA